MKTTIKTIFLFLAVICAFGAYSGWTNIFGTTHSLIAIGSAFMLLHAYANPDMVLKPLKNNTLRDGKWPWLGKAGLLFLGLGLIEVTRIFDYTPINPLLSV